MQGSSTVRCVDRAGLGQEAFELTIPSGWVFFGGVEWSADAAFAVQSNFAAASPDGRCAVQFFPDQAAAWTEDANARRSMPTTASIAVAPPPAPQEALRGWIVERHRRSVQPVEVVAEEELKMPEIPAVPREIQEAGVFSLPAMPRMGRVRIRYALQGAPTEEEFWGQLAVNRVPAGAGGMPFPYTFSVLNTVVSFRAPAGELDARLPALSGIQGSYRPNQEYFERIRRLFQPDPAAVQGGASPSGTQAAIQQHQMAVMRTVAEYSNRWNTLVQSARQGPGQAAGPLPSVAGLLDYPPEGRLLGTVAEPAAQPAPISAPEVPATPSASLEPTTRPPPGGFCTDCGAPRPPGANFCPSCGARLAPPAPPKAPPSTGAGPARGSGTPPDDLPVICPHCKEPLPPGSTACRRCGSPL